MDDLLREFLDETASSLNAVDAELVRLERAPNAKILDTIFRLVHSLKGGCGFLGLKRIEAIAHVSETLMEKFRAGAVVTPEAVHLILAAVDRMKALLNEVEKFEAEPEGEDDSLLESLERAAGAAPLAKNPDVSAARAYRHIMRVDTETFDEIADLANQLAATRDEFAQLINRNEHAAFKAPLQKLSGIAAGLQSAVLQARLQPIGNAWQKLPRLVRDLANELGKSVTFETSGEDIRLDQKIIGLLKDPLTHIVRNCIVHGIEMQTERLQSGKSEQGKIKLVATRAGNYTVVEIADDGRGLDLKAIKREVMDSGLATAVELEQMSERQIQDFVFAPGLTTANVITNVSGRGVGMDVVRNHAAQLNAAMELKSERGQGTSIIIKIPDTLSQLQELDQPETCEDDEKLSFILFSDNDGSLKALPFLLVSKTLSVDLSQIRIEGGRALALYQSKQIPVVNVSAAKDEGVRPMLVFSDAGRPIGLIVERIIGTTENETAIDIKSGRPGVIGTAQFNGAPADIIDVGYYLPRRLSGAA